MIDTITTADTLTSERIAELRHAWAKENHEICQVLGKALGYPWFKDDLKNFPDATEPDGVCVGEHVAVTIAMEAASHIATLRAECESHRNARRTLADDLVALGVGKPTVLELSRGADRRIAKLESERDVALAENARLRDLLARVKRVLPPVELYAEILRVLHKEETP